MIDREKFITALLICSLYLLLCASIYTDKLEQKIKELKQIEIRCNCD